MAHCDWKLRLISLCRYPIRSVEEPRLGLSKHSARAKRLLLIELGEKVQPEYHVAF
jgi:hypothetical protein